MNQDYLFSFKAKFFFKIVNKPKVCDALWRLSKISQADRIQTEVTPIIQTAPVF
jgi:hypothetical protein